MEGVSGLLDLLVVLPSEPGGSLAGEVVQPCQNKENSFILFCIFSEKILFLLTSFVEEVVESRPAGAQLGPLAAEVSGRGRGQGHGDENGGEEDLHLGLILVFQVFWVRWVVKD